MARAFTARQTQKSMLVGEPNLMGLPGETMRRMVPSKWLLINLVAAWKTASRQGGGVAVLFGKELLGHYSSREQQMVAKGRALVSDPKIMLLDEMSLGLAPIVVDQHLCGTQGD
jgi:ABC-type transporter Mla maintaining outer membrane lipid asymmetry ATPase subunit MlaF